MHLFLIHILILILHAACRCGNIIFSEELSMIRYFINKTRFPERYRSGILRIIM